MQHRPHSRHPAGVLRWEHRPGTFTSVPTDEQIPWGGTSRSERGRACSAAHGGCVPPEPAGCSTHFPEAPKFTSPWAAAHHRRWQERGSSTPEELLQEQGCHSPGGSAPLPPAPSYCQTPPGPPVPGTH